MFPVIAVKSIVKSSKQKLNMIINKHSSSGCGGSPWRLRTFLPPTALAPPQPGDQWRILVRNRFPSTLFILSSFAGQKNSYHCDNYLQQHLSLQGYCLQLYWPISVVSFLAASTIYCQISGGGGSTFRNIKSCHFLRKMCHVFSVYSLVSHVRKREGRFWYR